MKLAITGSCGFVGGYAVKYFSKKYEIIAFQRQKNESIGNIKYIKWDYINAYNSDFDCDIFIHSGADTRYEKSKKEMIKNNVLTNKNILEIVNNSSCKHFIYISSSSVYQGISGVIDENIEINENNLENSYALTKYLSENYIKENLNKNIKLTILRPRAIYGIGDRLLEPNILKHQIFGRLILLGNGKNITSITDINLFIKTIDKVIKKQKTNFEIFNISDDKTKNMFDIYKEIALKYKLKGIIKIPIFLLKTLKYLNKNKISYLIDNFEKDKILNIGKIKKFDIVYKK